MAAPHLDNSVPGFEPGFTDLDRLRLFAFTAAEKGTTYLWVLRAMERSRANYVVLQHAAEVAASLAALGQEQSDDLSREAVPMLSAEEVTPLLDQLYAWQVLDRSYDGARAATLAEYRNRHYVYQFNQAGYRAYRAVEDVLGARLDDATLSRLVLPELLADLGELAAANRDGDSELVYRKLSRLDSVLNEMAERAARFYLMLSDLSKSTETSAEVFLTHKDALIAHLREFSSELARYAPRLAAAVRTVQDTGVDRLVELAAEADERIFRSPADRLHDWQQRWAGLEHWFLAVPGQAGRCEADRLQDATISAVAAVLSLLRRVTEARLGGVNRESQLRHLAAWFVATPDVPSAHALFAAAFDLSRPRHVGVVHPDPELIPTRRTWWRHPPVEPSAPSSRRGSSRLPGAPADWTATMPAGGDFGTRNWPTGALRPPPRNPWPDHRSRAGPSRKRRRRCCSPCSMSPWARACRYPGGRRPPAPPWVSG